MQQHIFASDVDTTWIRKQLEQCYDWQYDKPDSILILAPIVQREAIKLDFPLGIGKSLYYIGHAHYELQHFDSALFYLKQAIPYFNENESLTHLAATYNIKSVCEKQLADYPRALQSQLTTIKYFEMDKDTSGLIIAYNNLGLLYNDQNKLKTAESWFVKGLNLAEKFNDDYFIIVSKSNIGFNLHSQDRYEEALTVFKEVLAFDIENGNINDIGASYNNLASCYLKLDDNKRALSYIDSSLFYKLQSGDKYGTAISYANKAEAYMDLNQLDKVKQMLDSALKYAETIQASSIKVDILEKYHLLFAKMGNFQEALNYYQQFHTLSDSLSNKETEVALTNIQRQFDLEKIDQNLKQKTIEVENFKSRQSLYLVILATTLLIIVILGVAFVRIRKLNKKLDEQKNEQIKTNLILTRVNEQLEVAKNEAEGSNRAKSAFLSNVSHEIRTPLNAIIGLLDQMHGQILHQNQNNDIQTIQHAAKSLLHIINDLLDLSKIESGKISFEEKTFNLYELLDQIAATLQSLVNNKSISIKINIQSSVPKYIVGDQYRLNQILLNLGSNAVKFTTKGQISLNVSVTGQENDYFQLKFEVIDTGIGIPEESQQSIFERFVQVDGQNSRKFGGTGLGLAICKKLVELQKGDIGLASKVGQGSTFWFNLAFKQSKFENGLRNDLAVKDSPSINGKRVLVVDDNLLNLKLAAQVLKRIEVQSVIVSSGKEAILTLQNNTFDAVLLDIHMPEMNGFDTFMAIRELEINCPIIALTADTFEETRQEIERFGFEGMLHKPYSSEELKQLLEKTI